MRQPAQQKLELFGRAGDGVGRFASRAAEMVHTNAVRDLNRGHACRIVKRIAIPNVEYIRRHCTGLLLDRRLLDYTETQSIQLSCYYYVGLTQTTPHTAHIPDASCPSPSMDMRTHVCSESDSETPEDRHTVVPCHYFQFPR